jgi:hypothetical protein
MSDPQPALTRYEFGGCIVEAGEPYAEMAPHVRGDWVRLEDVRRLFAREMLSALQYMVERTIPYSEDRGYAKWEEELHDNLKALAARIAALLPPETHDPR